MQIIGNKDAFEVREIDSQADQVAAQHLLGAATVSAGVQPERQQMPQIDETILIRIQLNRRRQNENQFIIGKRKSLEPLEALVQAVLDDRQVELLIAQTLQGLEGLQKNEFQVLKVGVAADEEAENIGEEGSAEGGGAAQRQPFP